MTYKQEEVIEKSARNSKTPQGEGERFIATVSLRLLSILHGS